MPRVRSSSVCARPARWLTLVCLSLPLIVSQPSLAGEISHRRLTQVVIAVREARPAVVSIQGQKTVAGGEDAASSKETPRQVNGVGTGAIVDERGYILTNYHVVSDVRRIEVTADDRRTYTAELVAYDEAADLAIIKIPAPQPLPTIRIGTSSDLMEGEAVIALGNAYGYEQTVTRGIISALNRDVQVSDTQSYDDLIQTDASINPGNSGGPLLNIDGEMIGVNVAVRAGAQGIGFAIPIDNALRVAADLLNVQRLNRRWHGLITEASSDPSGPLHIAKVESASPAADVGLQPGDDILQVGSLAVRRPLDLERAFLDRAAGDPLPLQVRRGEETLTLELALADYNRRVDSAEAVVANADDQRAWEIFGLKLSEEPRSEFLQRDTRYRGGMHVDDVRRGSPADNQGILAGDILVGMLRWETASAHDMQYIVSRPDLTNLGKIKFYVLRGQRVLYGHLNVASTADASNRPKTRR